MSQEISQLQKEVNPILVQANEIQIHNATTYQNAADFLKSLKSSQKKVLDFFSPMKKKAHETWKAICLREKQIIEPIQKCETTIKQKMVHYQAAEEQRRQAEEQRLQAEAEARAEKERQRKLKEAEKLKTPELKDQRITEAESIEAPVITVQPETPKVSGISTRRTWKAKITDKKAFLKAAIKDSNLLGFITIEQTKLDKIAQATQGELNYPGIEFYEHTSIASRGE